MRIKEMVLTKYLLQLPITATLSVGDSANIFKASYYKGRANIPKKKKTLNLLLN